MNNNFYQIKRSYLFLIFLTLACSCVPVPWHAWRYNYTYKFDSYPSFQKMPDREKFESLYVGESFIFALVIAHNETTRGGGPPYKVLVSVDSKSNEVKNVTFHSVKISSSVKDDHIFLPVLQLLQDN